LASLLREDLRFAMPPQPGVWVGRDAIVKSWVDGGFGTEEYADWRCRLTYANGQPAVGMYLRRPGDTAYRALALDVLRIADGLVAEITTFDDGLFPLFGLPTTLGV
jgi:RNA polymerase sigma-70 factor (ECF subfamily)